MNSSGAAIHSVSPSDSGPPMAKPRNPAACWRPGGSVGEPAHRCHSPSGGQRDHCRTEDEPRSCFWARLRFASAPRQSRQARWERGRRPIRSAREETCRSTGRRDARRRTMSWRRSPRRCRAAPVRCRRGDGRVRGRARGRRIGRWTRHPWPASTSRREHRARRSPLRTRSPTDCGVEPACGGAPRVAPGGTRPANRPLTCSNGNRIGRRSYWACSQA